MSSNVSTRVLAGAFALALVAAGCGGGGGSDPIAERELEEFNNTTTQAPEPDPTTTLATTTTTDVVETTTTAATTTTTLAPTQEQQRVEIIAAVEAYREAWRECLRQLPNCDTSVLSETRSGEQLDRSVMLATRWNADGYQARDIDSLTTRVETVSFFEGSPDVLVEVCETDGVVVFNETDPGQEGLGSALVSIMVLFDGSNWKVYQATADRSALGLENNLCA